MRILLPASERFTGLAVFQFIEGWYTPGRRHSALGYLSPISDERAARERLQCASP